MPQENPATGANEIVALFAGVRVAQPGLRQSNQIEEFIVFKPLGREEIREIVDLQIRQLSTQLESNGFTLEVTDSAEDLLANEGYDQNTEPVR